MRHHLLGRSQSRFPSKQQMMHLLTIGTIFRLSLGRFTCLIRGVKVLLSNLRCYQVRTGPLSADDLQVFLPPWLQVKWSLAQ